MQRVVLGEDDRKAIQAPEYALFRQAVLRVRTLESERPQLDEADPASVEAYAAFLDQLSLANQDASAIIVADGWTSNQRRLMQRVLQRATSDEVSGEGR